MSHPQSRPRVSDERKWCPPSAERPEEDLLDRLRSGEEAAFEELVHREGGRLLALARTMLRREEDARDAVQETFFAAFRSLARFRGESSLSTWLHRIAVNTALMRIRSSSRHPELSIEELLPRFDDQGRHASPVASWRATPADVVLQRETRAQVRAAVERLPLPYRTVLVLRDIEELSTEETASVLSLTTMAVKVRLHRARLALRTLLEPLFAGNAGQSPSKA